MSVVVRGALLACALGGLGCGEEVAASDPLTVSLLYPIGGAGDVGMADSMLDGVIAARVGTDFELVTREPMDQAEAEVALDETLATSGDRSLIIAGGELYAEGVNARACDFGGAMVLQLQGQIGSCKDLQVAELDTFGPAYLAGVMAVSAETLAPRRSLGIVGSERNRFTAPQIDGLTAGAEFAGGSVISDILDDLDLGDPDDQQAARERVAALLAQVDVVAMVGGDHNAELLEALHAYNEEFEPVLLIGVEQDLAVLEAELVLGSLLERWDVVVREAILGAYADTYASGRVRLGFRDRVTELYLSPAYADTALDGQPHPDCQDCATLQDAVDAAEARAADEALAYDAR